ncbi:MAG: ABC transporter permease [Candidatus Korobacteraceae bacterium]
MGLWRAIARRLLMVVLTIAVGGFVSAAMIRYSPGFGTDERQLDPRLNRQSIEAIRSASAGEQNIAVYYLRSMHRLLLGDLGISRSLHHPVKDLLAERSLVTLRMVGLGLAIAWTAAILLVVLTWLLRAERLETLCTVASGLLLCIPAGAMAILLVLADAPAYLALAFVVFPKIQRYLANLVSSTSRMPHMITAKSKGLSEAQLLLWHVVPIIRHEVLALVGVSLALAVSAAIPVEALCGVPGIGQLAWQSALARDLPVLMYVSLLVIACTVLANSGADLLADERRELS